MIHVHGDSRPDDIAIDRMRNTAVSEAAHGPADERRYSYEPTFLLRGLTELHIEFSPVH